MERFVDIHTHILPGVDDGAKDVSAALTLLKAAYAQGTGALVLTPHYRNHYRGNISSKLTEIYEELCREAKVECPDLELYLGCEVGYELDISEKLADGTLLTLNGTQYVLLEFRERSFRSRIMEGVLEVLNFGYIPIIAHAERYEAFRNHPELAKEVTHLGALIQINADSIMGGCGYSVKRCCRRLMKQHCVHFIASDAHNTKDRTPDLKACYQKVKKRRGTDYANALFFENARAMLSGSEEIYC